MNDWLIKIVFGVVAIGSICAIGFSTFDGNVAARHFGGTKTITLAEGERLVNMTWKGEENSLWVLTKTEPNTPPTKYTFREHSNFGMVEGKVIVIEQ